MPPTAPFGHRRNASLDSLMSAEENEKPRRPATTMTDSSEAYDFVLFGGEDEEQTAAELQWSQKVQKEGKLRRAKSRRKFTGKRQRPARLKSAIYSTVTAPGDAYFSMADLRPHSEFPGQAFGHARADSDTSDLLESYYSDASPGEEKKDPFRTSPSEEKKNPFLASADQLPLYSNTGESLGQDARRPTPSYVQAPHSPNPFRDETDDLCLDVSEAEMEDLHIISELARTGHPDIPKILDDEQERAEGKMIVACAFASAAGRHFVADRGAGCGPVKLNITVRGLVAQRINPKRVAKGDMRGQVCL